MAKAQTQGATQTANNMRNEVGPQIQPIVNNAQNQQQKLQTQADQSLAFGHSLAEPAANTYQNFASTGGFSPSDETTYLNRANQGVSGTYDVLAKAAERQRAAAGGLGTGGETAQMARQGTQQQSLATENAQADLAQMKNANKLAGAGGLANMYGQTNALYDAQTGAATAAGKQALDALGLRYNTEAEAGQILAELSKNPGILSNIKSITGMVGGGLTGLANVLRGKG